MEITRFVVIAVSFLLVVAGCSDSPSGAVRIAGDLDTRSGGLEQRISELAKHVAGGTLPEASFYEQFKEDVSTLSPPARKRAFEQVVRTFSMPTLKTNILSDRLRLFECHVANVGEMVFLFVDLLENPGEVWEYAFQSLAAFDAEKRNIVSGIVPPANPPMGLHIPPEEYLVRLDQKRFHAVRDVFEGRSFGLYYRALPIGQQKSWLSRIEKAARRNIVIFDPKNPGQLRPRMPK